MGTVFVEEINLIARVALLSVEYASDSKMSMIRARRIANDGGSATMSREHIAPEKAERND